MFRVHELDGLRGVAVLLVVAYHYANLPMGWAGVDVFFVLSGYLITSRLIETREHPYFFRDFYARRARRIWPLAYLLLAIYTVGLVAVGWPVVTDRIWWSHLVMVSSWHTVRYDPAWPVWIQNGLNVWWSLSIEEWFYVAWAPLIFVLKTPRARLVLIASVLLGAPALRAVVHDASAWEYAWLPARADALAWGALVAVLPLAVWRRLGLPAIGLGLALVGLTAAQGRDSLLLSVAGYSLIAATSAASVGWLVASAGARHPVRAVLRWGWLRYLGVISYAVYLVHVPIWGLLDWLPWMAQGGAAFCLTVILSALSWRYIERPLLRPLPHPHGSRREALSGIGVERGL